MRSLVSIRDARLSIDSRAVADAGVEFGEPSSFPSAAAAPVVALALAPGGNEQYVGLESGILMKLEGTDGGEVCIFFSFLLPLPLLRLDCSTSFLPLAQTLSLSLSSSSFPPPKKKQLAWAVDLDSRPVALHFLPELNACFAATVAGRLALVGSADGDVEEIGSVAAGLAAAAVGKSGGSAAASSIAAAVAQGDCGAGDGSAVALAAVTASGRLLVLSLPTWEALADVELCQRDPVPVPAREVAAEEAEAAAPPRGAGGDGSDDDDDDGGDGGGGGGGPPRLRLAPEDVSISWRGDGAAFATVSRAGRGGGGGGSPSSAAPFVVRTWDAASLLGDAEGAPPPPPTSATFVGASGVAGGIGAKGMSAPSAASSGDGPGPRSRRRLLTAVGERVEGLARASAWQPNGRHLFVAVEGGEGKEGKMAKSSSVALFERNGLGHGRFGPLTTSSSSRVSSLCWSPDSELLAASLVIDDDGGDTPSSSSVVQLWRRSNWHWYLQAELRSSCSSSSSSTESSSSAVAVAFADGAAPGTARLCLATSSSTAASISVRTIDYVLDVAGQSRRGTVAVVDGSAALVTSLAREVVPPPLCSAPVIVGGGGGGAITCLALGEAVPHSSASASASFEVLAALRSDGRLFLSRARQADDWASALEEATEGGADEVAALAGDDAEGRPPSMPARDSGLNLRAWLPPGGGAEDASAVRSLAFAGRSGALLAVVSGSCCSSEAVGREGGDFLVPISVDAEALTASVIGGVRGGGMEGGAAAGPFERTSAPVLAAADAGGDAVLLQLAGGELLLWSAGSGGLLSGAASLSRAPAGSFPAPCPWMRALPRSSSSSSPSSPLALGLSLAGELCLGSAVVARGVTSAALRHGGGGGCGEDSCSSSSSLSSAAPPKETFVLFTTADDVLHSMPLSLLLSAGRGGGEEEDGLSTAELGKQQRQQRHELERNRLQGQKRRATNLTAAIRTGEMASDMRDAMRGAGVGSTAAGDASSRAVERGSRLVVAPPAVAAAGGGGEEEGEGGEGSLSLWDGCRVVLQMPRGNLETVVPRSLALEAVAASLALGLGGGEGNANGNGNGNDAAPTKPQRLAALRRAWLCAVANRLDVNLVVDYAWPRFLERAGEFVEALGDDAALADLLCALKPESTLKATMTAATMGRGSAAAAAASGGESSGGAYSWIPLALPNLHGGAAGAFGDDADDEDEATKGAKQDKVRRVAAALRDALKKGAGSSNDDGDGDDSSEASFLKPILTSYAVLGDLLSALAAVRRARERELAQERGREEEATAAAAAKEPSALASPSPLGLARRAAARSATTADEGIRHLLLTVPFEALYRAALRLHDVQLAHLVVLSAGRDPGEHLPTLRQLASAGKSGSAMRAYAVERHLGRPRAALRALLGAAGVVVAVAGEGERGDGGVAEGAAARAEFPRPLFDEALSLARSAGLTRELVAALTTATASSVPSTSSAPASPAFAEARALALRAHAHALVARGKAEDAALALLAAGDRDSAIAAYASAGAWQPALALASGVGGGGGSSGCGGGAPSASPSSEPWPRRKIEVLASDLADALAQEGRLPEAAEVSLAWLRDDADRAVGWLAAAGQWRRALAAAAQAGRPDLAETTLAPLSAEAASTTLGSAREDARRAVTYLGRYREVQGKRRAMEAAFAEAEANRGGESDDDGAAAAEHDFDDGASDASGVSGLSAYTSTSTITGRGGSSPSDSSSNSSISASTVGGRAGRGGSGGRRAETKRAKAERRGRRRGLRAGGAHEEEGLAALLVYLRPSDDALSSAGQLSELLVMLGHEQDAAALQVAMAELASSSSAAGEFVAASPPKVVESETKDKEKKKKGVAPQWKWDVLRPMMTSNETSALDSDEDDFGAFCGLGHGLNKRGAAAEEEKDDDDGGGLFS